MSYTPPKYEQFKPLPNVRRLAEKEFAQIFGPYTPIRVFCAEVDVTDSPDELKKLASYFSGDRSYLLATAFEMGDGTGFAIKTDYYAGKVHYFSFAACHHERQESRTVGRCLTRYTCLDCGYIHTVDSSD